MESRLRFLPPDPRSEWTEKLHGFLDPADDKPEHFAAIGRLITAFNGIDVILNMILRHQLGAETKIGRAIIGAMRTGDMLASIKRLAKVTGMDAKQLAEAGPRSRRSVEIPVRTPRRVALCNGVNFPEDTLSVFCPVIFLNSTSLTFIKHITQRGFDAESRT
jgi:hypothetical protein